MNTRGLVVAEDPGSQPGITPPGTVGALQPVGNQPIAHHVLDVLEAAGVSEIVVACSVEQGEEVRRCLAARERQSRVKLRYVQQPAPIDFAAGLTLAGPVIGAAPCIAHVADGLLEEPLAPFLQELAPDSPDVVLIVHQGPARDGHLSAPVLALLHVAELDPERPALGMAGVSLFGPGALRRAAGIGRTEDGELDWATFAEGIGAAGGTLQTRLANAWRRYTGSPFELLQLNRIALDRLQSAHPRNDNHGNRIEGRVRIHERASIRSSVIVGPVVIGAEAHIADAYIGPYTSVGPHARVEGAEIESSIIAADATIMHIGSRLASSVIGQNARVYRDFSMPRAIRLHITADAEIALC